MWYDHKKESQIKKSGKGDPPVTLKAVEIAKRAKQEVTKEELSVFIGEIELNL